MDKDLRYKIVTYNIKEGNNATERSLARASKYTSSSEDYAKHEPCIRSSTNSLQYLINEFAMVLDTINPTIDIIKEIQSDISRAVPAASHLLSEMTSMTSDVLHSSNIKSEVGKISTSMDADALSI